MESGRFLLAIILMIAVVVVTNLIFRPVPPTPATPADTAMDTTAAAPSVATTGTDSAAPPRTDSAAPPRTEPPRIGADPEPMLPADTVLVRSDLFEYGITTHGAQIAVARLLQYESFAPGREGEVVQLVPEQAASLIRHRLRIGERVIDLGRVAFTPSTEDVLELGPDGQQQLQLTWTDSASALGVDFTFTFDPGRYLIAVHATVRGATGSPQLLIDMGPRIGANEADANEDERALAYVINNQSTGIESVPLRDLDQNRVDNGPLTWVALKSKYFLAALMESASNPMPFGGVIANPTGNGLGAELTATLLPGENGEFAYRLYLGPQEFDRLAAVGNQLQDVSVFGWRFLQPVLRPLGHAISWALLQLHRALGLGYGWVLILFGFLIRFVLWPLNAKAMRSQLKNMELQPRMKELQARYKNDPQKLQQEMIKLYKEEGFNPMGGCLPMLLPLPVLITLFFVFQSTIEFRGVPFLWLPDLARKDPLYILPVALGLSMFIQQWLNMRSTKDAPPQMKWMTYFMPLFLTFLFLNFASGLNLYYAAMNIASVPQQLQIMKEKQRRQAAAKK